MQLHIFQNVDSMPVFFLYKITIVFYRGSSMLFASVKNLILASIQL